MKSEKSVHFIEGEISPISQINNNNIKRQTSIECSPFRPK